jgi:hypothetical protein
LPGVNPEIRRKIHELIGEDAPSILKDFFDDILAIETKQEITMDLEPKELFLAYQSVIDKYSQEKKILDFINSKSGESD